MKRKGFFFTVDALMALAVLTVGFMLIYASYSSRPLQGQTTFFSSDIIDQMSHTEIKFSDHPEIFRMWCSRCDGARHIIDMPDNTVLEQIGEFVYQGNIGYARELAGNFTEGLINPQYGYEITITGTDITGNYDTWIVLEKDKHKLDKSRLAISSKKLIYGTINKSVIWGPMVPEVKVWQ